MVEINLHKLLGISSIEVANNQRFKQIKEKLSEYPADEDITLDFRHFYIKDTKNPDFYDIVTDKRVKLVLYDREQYNLIRFICMMAGMDASTKLTLNIITMPGEESKEVKETRRYKERLRENTVKSEDRSTATIYVKNAFGYIDRAQTLNALFDLIDDLYNEGCSKVVANLEDVQIYGDTKKKEVASKIKDILKSGKDFEIKINDDELSKVITGLIELYKSGRMNNKQKYELLIKEFPVKTAGLLVTYKSSAGKDIFGRTGHGEIATNLPAIIEEIHESEVIFRTFRVNTFETKLDYMVNHDNEEHPGLMSDIKIVPIDELGIGAYCVGSRYHFNLPVQFDKRGYHQVCKHNGYRIDRHTVSLPQHMSMVFNDFDVEYNDDNMSASKRITKEILKKKGLPMYY